MATVVRTGVNPSDNMGDFGNRLLFTLTNGNVIAIIHDFLVGGTADRIFIYESSNRTTWNLLLTVDAGDSVNVTACVKSNNDIVIARMGPNYQGITLATYSYAAGTCSAFATVATVTGAAKFGRFDLDVSDEGAVYVATMVDAGAGAPYGWWLLTRNVGSGVWNVAIKTLHSAGRVDGCESISVCTGTKSGANQNVALAVGYSQGAADKGVKLYHLVVTPASGVVTNDATSLKSTLLAGSGNPKSTYAQGRLVRLFRDPTDADKIVIAIMHSELTRDMLAARASFAQGLKLTTAVAQAKTEFGVSTIGSRYMGITHNSGVLNFLYGAKIAAFANKTICNYTARWGGATDNKYSFSTRSMRYLTNGYIAGREVSVVYSSGQRDGGGQKYGDILIQTKVANNNRKWYHEYAPMSGTPNSVIPGNGSSVVSSQPKVSAKLDTGRKFAQVRLSLQALIASDSGFTSNVVPVLGDQFVIVDGSDGNLGIYATAQVAAAYSLAPNNTWYLKTRQIDEFGKVSAYSVVTTFTVSHPPTISDMKPAGGANLAYGDSGLVNFSWTTNDAAPTDHQAAYQLQIINQGTGALVLDTGKVSSQDTMASGTTDPSLKGTALAWRVRAWDTYDDPGPWSGYQTYYLWDGPVVSNVVPAPDSAVLTPTPHFEFTITADTGAQIADWTVTVTEGRTLVFTKSRDSGVTPDASPKTYTVDGSNPVYRNTHSYTITITATDSRKIKRVRDPYTITVAYDQPAAPTQVPTLDTTHYSVENEGWVQVNWNGGGENADFISYTVCRKDDLIEPYTQEVLAEGDWHDVGTIYGLAASYEFHDVLAPSNYRTQYALKQNIAKFGDVVSSELGPTASCFPYSDAYWLVDPDFGGSQINTIKLWNVTADSYTENYERSEYFIIGRGMHVDTGERMGYSGQITATLRNSGGVPARKKKLVLESIRDTQASLYLRNPFGDVFPVSTGDIAVERLPGFDRQEFCNVTIPYLEVGR